jgi:Ca2+-binding RTX toxin-like protein
MRADGSERKTLDVRGDLPTWSPDGSRIAFLDSGRSTLATVRADGTDRRVLFRLDADYSRIDWGLVDARALEPLPPCIVKGSAVADTLTGTAHDDIIYGLGGDDRIRGLAGADWLIGDDGRDVIIGGSGDDAIEGGPGNDRIAGGAGNDSIDTGGGANVIFGGTGSDTIRAKSGKRDIVDCGEGRDSVFADRVDVQRHCERVHRTR